MERIEEELDDAETRQEKLTKQLSDADMEQEICKRMQNELFARERLERPKLQRMDSQLKDIKQANTAVEERLTEVRMD